MRGLTRFVIVSLVAVAVLGTMAPAAMAQDASELRIAENGWEVYCRKGNH